MAKWVSILLLHLVTSGDVAEGGKCALDKPSLSWSVPEDLGFQRLHFLALEDGWLGLATVDGRVQLRSPTGEWSQVLRLPVDVILKTASTPAGLLVEGKVLHDRGSTVFLVDSAGKIAETWRLSQPLLIVHSLTAWKDTYWATVSDGWTVPSADGLVQLLPGGKIARSSGIPETEEDGQIVVPWDAALTVGPAGERIFCVPPECRHDGPCHYGYCYRKDTMAWREWGEWKRLPVPCGDYLLEHEVAGPGEHLKFRHNRIVIRRISNGERVSTVNATYDSIVCAGPDAFLGVGTSVTRMSLPSGQRQWSTPVPRDAGYLVAMAWTGMCAIGLTNKGAMLSICQAPNEKLVTTIGR